ncbi:MAG: hypothetical protein ACRDNH_00665 [Gaiellaceae bacterium]
MIAPLAVFAGERVITRATEPDPTPTVDPKPTPELKVIDVAVQNDLDSSPQIDLRVMNEGDLVSFITRAALRIRGVDDIHGPSRPDCYQGAGFFAPTRAYDIALPSKGGTGETITASNVSQEVKPRAVDRFLVRVAVPPNATSSKRAPTIGVSRLFQLEILIFHDGKPEPLNAGRVLVAAPFPRDVYFDRPRSLGEVENCELENRAILNGFLEQPGARDDALATFARAAAAGKLFDE